MTYINTENHPNIQHNIYYAKDKIHFSRNDGKIHKQIDRVGVWQQSIHNLCNGREFLNILDKEEVSTDNIYLRMIFLNGHHTNLSLEELTKTFVSTPQNVTREEFEKILKEYIVEVNFEILK